MADTPSFEPFGPGTGVFPRSGTALDAATDAAEAAPSPTPAPPKAPKPGIFTQAIGAVGDVLGYQKRKLDEATQSYIEDQMGVPRGTYKGVSPGDLLSQSILPPENDPKGAMGAIRGLGRGALRMGYDVATDPASYEFAGLGRAAGAGKAAAESLGFAAPETLGTLSPEAAAAARTARIGRIATPVLRGASAAGATTALAQGVPSVARAVTDPGLSSAQRAELGASGAFDVLAGAGMLAAESRFRHPETLHPEELAEGHEAGFYQKLTRNPALTGDAKAVETRFADAVEANPERYMAEYRRMFGNTVSADNARELSPDYTESKESRSKYAPAIQEPSSFIAGRVYDQILSEPVTPSEHPTAIFTGGGPGVGKTTGLASAGVSDDMLNRSHVVMDSTLSSFDSAKAKIDKALKANLDPHIAYTWRNPVDAWENGVLPRAERDGRVVPLDYAYQTYVRSANTALDLQKAYADNPRVHFYWMDNSFGKGNARVMDPEALRGLIQGLDPVDLKARMADTLLRKYQNGQISQRVFLGAGGDPAAVIRPGEPSVAPPVQPEQGRGAADSLPLPEQVPAAQPGTAAPVAGGPGPREEAQRVVGQGEPPPDDQRVGAPAEANTLAAGGGARPSPAVESGFVADPSGAYLNSPDHIRENVENHARILRPGESMQGLGNFTQRIATQHYDRIIDAIDSVGPVHRAAIKVHEGSLERGVPTIWALGWEPGQATEIHDHKTSTAAVHVMRGAVGETVFKAPPGYVEAAKAGGFVADEGTHVLPKDSVMYVKAPYVHMVSGAQPGRSVTLHSYYPPLQAMNYFERSADGNRLVWKGEWDETKPPEDVATPTAPLEREATVAESRPLTEVAAPGTGTQVSWEATPHPTTGVLPGAATAPYEQREKYTNDVRGALYDKEGNDELATALGIGRVRTAAGPGLYKGEFNPGFQGQIQINAENPDRVERYAAGIGLAMHQEAVAYHRPIFEATPSESNGVQFDMGRSVNRDELGSVYSRLKTLDPKAADSIALVPTPEGLRALNFSELPNLRFHGLVEQAVGSGIKDGAADWRTFRSAGDLVYNDWTRSPNGEDYLQRLRAPGGPDVSGALDNIRGRVAAINDRYAKAYGWDSAGAAEATAPHPAEAVAPPPLPPSAPPPERAPPPGGPPPERQANVVTPRVEGRQQDLANAGAPEPPTEARHWQDLDPEVKAISDSYSDQKFYETMAKRPLSDAEVMAFDARVNDKYEAWQRAHSDWQAAPDAQGADLRRLQALTEFIAAERAQIGDARSSARSLAAQARIMASGCGGPSQAPGEATA